MHPTHKILMTFEELSQFFSPAMEQSRLPSASGELFERTTSRGGPADPAPPFIVPHDLELFFELDEGLTYQAQAGQTLIFGTHNAFLFYPSWEDFEANIRGLVLPLRLFDHKGHKIENEEAVWDPALHILDFGQGKPVPVIFAGVMSSPTSDDLCILRHNIGRRIGAYLLKDGKWLLQQNFVTGIPGYDSWIGHSYGHHIRKSQDGRVYLHFEMVDEEKEFKGSLLPWKTSLYEVELKSPTEPLGQPRKIFDPAFPKVFASTQRLHAELGESVGFLAEGQRLHEVSGTKLILNSFSVANFCDLSYGSCILYGNRSDEHGTIDWKPLLNHNGTDLKVITQSLQRRFNINWCGRVAFYETKSGELRALFHGIPNGAHIKAAWTSKEVFRTILDASVRIELDERGELLDLSLGSENVSIQVLA